GVSDEGNSRSLIVLDGKLFDREGAAGVHVDAISWPPSPGRRSLQNHLSDADPGSRQTETGIGVVLDDVSGESRVGAVEGYAVTGGVVDGVATEAAHAELAAHDVKPAAVEGEIGHLDMGASDPEDRAAVEALDRRLVVAGVHADDGQAGEVIDSNGVSAG